MKWWATLVAFFLCYLAFGVFLNLYDIAVVKTDLEPANSSEYYDYRGITHVHSQLSQGSGDYAHIISEAQTSKIDFILLTDLNLVEPVSAQVEGYNNQLLVLPGGEHSYLDSHFIFYHPNRQIIFDGLGMSQAYFADLVSQAKPPEELFIMAHPLKPGHQWSGHYPDSLDGIEVINFRSLWQRQWPKNRASYIWSLVIFPFNPTLSLLRLYYDPIEEFQLWDSLNQKHKVSAFLGHDSTAKLISILGGKIKWPSYSSTFSLASNHVLLKSELTGNYRQDASKVFSALKSGQFYLSLDILGNPKGFFAEIINPQSSKTFPLGSQLNLVKGMILKVNLPQKPLVPFEIVIYRNGVKQRNFHSVQAQYEITQAGVYRVVVRVIPTLPLPDGRRWFTWIYTNPFYIRPAMSH